MSREAVIPGVPHRGRNKFGGCCGCCRMFVDRFGSLAYDFTNQGVVYRRSVGPVNNGWITAKGDCSIDYINPSPESARHLKLSGPDCMLVRDMRATNFTIDYLADYISGGFTLGAVYDPIDQYILFHPEKEHRFLFNWVDENNFDFISYWDWNLLNDYTIFKVGIRENGSERFILPTHYGLQTNGYTYTTRVPYRKFCYVDDIIFIDTAFQAGVAEAIGYSVTYKRPLRSKFCGIGTGPQFTGDWVTNLFAVSKTIDENQRRKDGSYYSSNYFDGAFEDCKWCPRPIGGCSNYQVPAYIVAEKFNDSGVSQYTVNLGDAGSNIVSDSGRGYSGSTVVDDTSIGVSLAVEADYISQFGFPIPNTNVGTVRLDEYTTVLFSTFHKLYANASTVIRDDCDAWDHLRLDPTPDYHPPETDTVEPDGYWELTGVYEL